MSDTTEPVLGPETLRDMRVYADSNDDGERVYVALWAVHGTEHEIEYPVVSWAHNQTVYSSADTEYADIPDETVDAEFYEYLAGQVARLIEEGGEAIHTMDAFVPDALSDAEAWLAQQCLLSANDGSFPYEVEWAIERGVSSIEADIDADEVFDGSADDGEGGDA